MQNFGIMVPFRPRFEKKKLYGPSITHKDEHFAIKTAIILDENLKGSILSPPFPQFNPFYVKNGNSYIVIVLMFIKGIFLRNALQKC